MKHDTLQFSAVELNLTQKVLICDLHLQQSQYAVHWDHLSLDEVIQEFHGVVIGQDGNLIHAGDFVMLSTERYTF